MVERRREVPVTARFIATATGNDGNAGTLAAPWKTINRGTQGPEVQPGDCRPVTEPLGQSVRLKHGTSVGLFHEQDASDDPAGGHQAQDRTSASSYG